MVASGIDTSLVDALRQLVRDSRAAVRLALFRIVEECVNNAIRHGRAQNVAIRITDERRARGHIVGIEVANDGIMPQVQSREGVGFRVLRARAAAFNARVTTIQNGTLVAETLLETSD